MMTHSKIQQIVAALRDLRNRILIQASGTHDIDALRDLIEYADWLADRTSDMSTLLAAPEHDKKAPINPAVAYRIVGFKLRPLDATSKSAGQDVELFLGLKGKAKND